MSELKYIEHTQIDIEIKNSNQKLGYFRKTSTGWYFFPDNLSGLDSKILTKLSRKLDKIIRSSND